MLGPTGSLKGQAASGHRASTALPDSLPLTVPAAVIRAKCHTSGAHAEELEFKQRRIVGKLDLSDTQLGPLVRFTDCDFPDGLDLTGAWAREGIILEDCRIRRMEAKGLKVDGDVLLDRVTFEEGAVLSGLRCGGSLRCTGSRFKSNDKKALVAVGMNVQGAVLFTEGFRAWGEIDLTDTRIGGSLDMSGAELEHFGGVALLARAVRIDGELLLVGCQIRGSVELYEAAVIGTIRCSRSRLTGDPASRYVLDARLLRADELVLDQGFSTTGQVCLDGSRLTGRLCCNGGTFTNKGDKALSADGVTCRDARLGEGFQAYGEVSMTGSRFTSELNCSRGALFVNPGGRALQARGLSCGRVYLNSETEGQFRAQGAVILRDARIKVQLDCEGGSFENPGGTAFDGKGLSCAGPVALNHGFRAVGKVSLIGATVERLTCNKGQFDTIHAQRLTVKEHFIWKPAGVPRVVDVSYAKVGELLDDPGAWPEKREGHRRRTVLTGFTFASINDGMDVQKRIDWLKQASRYAPDVYQQLVRIYREDGRTKDAQRLYIAGERHRRKDGGMSWPTRAWSWFLDVSVGYGYRIHRALLLVLGTASVGVVFFYLARNGNLMEAVDSSASGKDVSADECTAAYPCFMPVPYSFELFLPPINLRQVSYWLPNAKTGWGKALFAYVWLSIGTGWLMTTAVIAGINRHFGQQS
jgi:hypothetical protein